MKIIKYIIALAFIFVGNLIQLQAADKAEFKIGVNRFAWYATLQTINFLPIASADPFGGIIISDWYQLNDKEQYKIVVYILEENLTSSTVEVKLFKKIKQNGIWVDAPSNNMMQEKIENSILNLARQLRIQYSLRNK